MNMQLLEYVRNELMEALMDSSVTVKGQLEAFKKHSPIDRSKYPPGQIRPLESEGRHGVKAKTLPVKVTETRARCLSMPLIKEHQFLSCTWRRAVLALEEHQQAWVRYCYGSDVSFRYQTILCEYVWNKHWAKLAGRQLRTKLQKRLMALVWVAAQDTTAKKVNHTYKHYSGTALASMISVTRQTWSEIYAPHWLQFNNAFETLDEKALERVLKMRDACNF